MICCAPFVPLGLVWVGVMRLFRCLGCDACCCKGSSIRADVQDEPHDNEYYTSDEEEVGDDDDRLAIHPALPVVDHGRKASRGFRRDGLTEFNGVA